MKFKFLLARLAGARVDVLEQLPGAVPKQTAMGAVLLTTAGFAAISAGYAMAITGIATGIFAVLVGLVWGLAILNLDRMLVIGLAKETGFWRNLSLAAPRVVLAIILGIVISTPLMLKIFDSEIEAQMNRNIIAAQEDLRQSLNNSTIRQDLDADITELNRLKTLINTGPTADVSQNPQVLLAQQAIDDLEAKATTQKAEYDQLRGAAVAEEEGSAGTMVRGCAALCVEKRRLADEAEGRWQGTLNQVQDKENELAAIIANVQGNAFESSERAIADAQSAVPGLEAQVDQLSEQVNNAQNSGRELEQANAGIIARLKALNDVSGDDATAALAHRSVAALFMAMELLPVLFKVISNLGRRTAYDEVVDSYEDSEVKRATRTVSLDDRKAHMRRDADLSADKDRINRQRGLQLKINKSVADHQASVVEEALARWSEHAKQVSDDRLDDWASEMRDSYAPHRPPSYGSAGGFSQHSGYGYGGSSTTTYPRTVNGLQNPDDI